ncbi:unnamed protein product [Bursaphelenchus okinawaensis]|uniref:Uncharacterized protein n=1 Tax=Bursaphelenchus okinawaensis TaxID=465554 RepID=A0A811JT11_9BILA|nr:unnamed protein product [Bursaphelenchus okinawaensis]CAG9081750.1 unnamed protein product [Bursaphelenchus okinawaensis]
MCEIEVIRRGCKSFKSLTSLPVITRRSKLDVSYCELDSLYFHKESAQNVIVIDASGDKIEDSSGLHLFTSLEELNLSFNKLKKFEANYFTQGVLTVLNLDGNAIGDSLDVSAFTKLKFLSLNSCELSTLTMANTFPITLKTLLLRDNRIEDLREVNHIRHLELLEEIDLSKNPCLSQLDSSLARIALKALIYLNLNTINGVKLDSDAQLRAESLQMMGVAKLKTNNVNHNSLIEFIKQKTVNYEPPKTPNPAVKTGLTMSAPAVRHRTPLRSSTNTTPFRQRSMMPRKPLEIDSGRPCSVEAENSKLSPNENAHEVSATSLRSKDIDNLASMNITEMDFYDSMADESFSSSRTVTISKENDLSNQVFIPQCSKPFQKLNVSQSSRKSVGEMLKTQHMNRLKTPKSAKKKGVPLKAMVNRLLAQSKREFVEEIALLKQNQSRLESQIEVLEKENRDLKDFVEDQLEIVPTDIKFKHYSGSNFIIKWKNVPKMMLNIDRHELELNGEVFNVRGTNEKALIADPRDRETIKIRTVNKKTGKKSTATEVVFSKSPIRENDKENYM